MADPTPTTVRLQNIAQSYGQSAALMAAVEIGVFTAISNGAGTYEEVAQAVDIHPTNAERLMVMLCAAGLLEKADGRHRNAADVERYLVEGKPGYMGPWITFTKPQWTQWGRLAEHLRTKDLKVMGSIETFTVADARRYHDATYSIGLGAGRRFVRQVDLSGRKRIMDIGGGSGAYCIAAAKEHADASAPWCSTCRSSARWRATSSPPTASPTASRPRPATSRAIRSRPIATSPSWPPTCRCTAVR